MTSSPQLSGMSTASTVTSVSATPHGFLIRADAFVTTSPSVRSSTYRDDGSPPSTKPATSHVACTAAAPIPG